MSNPRQNLTSGQAADYLGVNVRQISRLVARGELTPVDEIPGGKRGKPLAFLFDVRDVELCKLRRERQEAKSA